MTESIQVFTAANEAYAISLCASITSMLRHASCKLDIIVFDGGISDLTWGRIEASAKGLGRPCTINRHIVGLEDFAGLPLLRSSALTYARLLIERFSNRSKVLYIDSDTVVQADLRMLMDVSLDGSIVGAVRDPVVWTIGNERIAANLPEVAADTAYFNAGVLLIDMELWKKDCVSRKCIEFLVSSGASAQYHDQSALNYCLIGRWKPLPTIWNSSAYAVKDTQGLADAKILHYLGWYKPWIYGMHTGPAADRFYEALKGTYWEAWRPSWFKFQLKRLKYHISTVLKR